MATRKKKTSAKRNKRKPPANKKAGGPVQKCLHKEEPLKPKQECYISKVKLTEIFSAQTKVASSASGLFNWSKFDELPTEKPEEPRETEITADEVAYKFDVGGLNFVGGPKKDKNKVLQVDVTYASTCGATHPLITVQRSGEPTDVTRGASKNVDLYRAKRLYDKSPASSLAKYLSQFWVFDTAPNHFLLTAESHGTANDPHQPVIADKIYDIYVYPDDMYEFALKLPPTKTVSKTYSKGIGQHETVGGDKVIRNTTKSEKKVETRAAFTGKLTNSSTKTTSATPAYKKTVTSESHTNADGNVQTHERAEYATKTRTIGATITDTELIRMGFGGTLKKESKSGLGVKADENGIAGYEHQAAEASGFDLEFRVGGEDDKQIRKLKETLLKAVNFIDEVSKAVKSLKELYPEIGISYEGSWSRFEGDLKIAWGWKEVPGDIYSVYKYIAAEATLTLFKASFEVFVGLKLKWAGMDLVKIGLSLKGTAEIKISGKIQRTAKKTEAPLVISAPGKADISAAASAVSDACDWVKFEGSIKLPFATGVSVELGGSGGPALKFDGVTAGPIEVAGEAKFGERYSKKGTVKWPDESWKMIDKVDNLLATSK